MPTAAAFDAAARSFDRAAAELEALMVDAPAHFGPDTLEGGLLTLVAESTVGAADLTARSAATGLFGLGELCRQRAAACRAFAADLHAYNVAMSEFENHVQNYDPTDPYALPAQRPVRPRPAASFIEV